MNYQSTRGIDFTRRGMAMAQGAGRPATAAQIAANRWGSRSTPAVELQKSAVGGLESTDNGDSMGVGSSASEFLDAVHSLSILGRLQGLRRVPVNVPIVLQPGTAVAYWVGESKAIPMSRSAFTRSRLRTLKIGALTVFSKDLVAIGGAAAEASLRDDLLEAAVRVLDLAFIDPSSAGQAGIAPASITSGIMTYQSTGDLADDVELALQHFTGNLMRASWIMSARLAAQAGIRAGGKGVGADLGARGGTLAGLPVVTSESVPITSDGGMLALVDASSIAVVEEDPEITQSEHAMIEMDTAPTGATDTPTAASATRVGMFDTDSVAMKLTLRANFVRSREGSVIVIDDANYGAP